MAQVPELEPHKRKRDIGDIGEQPAHHHIARPSSSHQTADKSTINYLPRPNAQRLALIQGDSETFADIIHLIGEYEGVLDHNESLAASLGAKLTGPRFLKGIEKFFDGPIKVSSSQNFPNPITWVDVVTFAKANPTAFTLTTLPDHTRCCRFLCKGLEVEITEDDWRLISSRALDRFPLEHPLEEDETAELATLDILEQRASALYKKADEVAARARILHHKLGHRKHDLVRRRENYEEDSGARFHAVNHPQRGAGHGSTSYDLHADLLQQFASDAPATVSAPPSAPQSRSNSGAGASAISANLLSPRLDTLQHQRPSGQSGFLGPIYPSESGSTPVTSGLIATADTQAEIYRPLVTQKTDKLVKGDTISPPCDRCRRLRLQCIKHLTACQGCTKKHAKCSWKSVTEEEATRLRSEMGMLGHHPSFGGEGTVETEMPGSRGSGIIRTPGSIAPGSVLFDSSSRPASRAETDAGGSVSYGRNEPLHEPHRTGLPTENIAGSGQPVMVREHPRMGQISSLLSPSDYDRQPFGHLQNPHPR